MKNGIWIAFIIVTLVIIVDYLWFQDVPPCSEPASVMSEFDKVAFQMLSDMNKYLISLATLLLGSLGALGIKARTLKQDSDRSHLRSTLSVAGSFGIGSLYFGFDSHVGLAEAAINNCAEFGSKMEVAQFLQFTTLVVGLLITLYLIYQFLGYERNNE